jgi:hypothetical protein
MEADTLLAHNDRADVLRGSELYQVIYRVAAENLHTLSLHDTRNRLADFHGTPDGLKQLYYTHSMQAAPNSAAAGMLIVWPDVAAEIESDSNECYSQSLLIPAVRIILLSNAI